jgi:hypothetical protein
MQHFWGIITKTKKGAQQGLTALMKHRNIGLAVVFGLFCSLFLISSSGEAVEDIKRFFVPSPPFTPGIFPCSQCHQGMPVNNQPRKLEMMHTEIELKHLPGGWCFDCHNPSNKDKLRLANGKLIDFEESYYLCAQCHGVVFRDWKSGIHGKRTGMWNGDKQYMLCVHCHSPHNSAFKPFQPLPPPVNPSDIK